MNACGNEYGLNNNAHDVERSHKFCIIVHIQLNERKKAFTLGGRYEEINNDLGGGLR